MALGAMKFIGLAVSAVVLGVLSASFAFSHIGTAPGHIAGSGSDSWITLNGGSSTTEDEIQKVLGHIVRSN